MSYTKEEIEIGEKLWKGFIESWQCMYRDWLNEITQTKPAPKYRCINNSWPFLAYDIEGMIYTSDAFYNYSLFPNHFEPVPEEKPITMAEAVEELEEWLYNHSGDRQEIDEIIERMKKAAQ